MALTKLQRDICRLLAKNRIESGESYVAGGVALNEAFRMPRISRDIDLFHDTYEAVEATWLTDRRLLEESGFRVEPIRELRGFVQASVIGPDDSVKMEWVRDSAYRFLPLQPDPLLGLTLHPLDLATNKVLALVGRLEVRDWIDAIGSHERFQPLGYLAWAACGKDPGFSPSAIIELAARSHYSDEEVAQLAFEGPPPSAADLSRKWHAMIESARQIVTSLPPAEAGKAVFLSSGELCRDEPKDLMARVRGQGLVFHQGRVRGALPVFADAGR